MADDKEILEKAIQKAIDGGFKENDYNQEIESVEDVYYYFDDGRGNLSINDLIWRHDFAKGLWGEEWDISLPAKANFPYYKYHLMQMVISPNPIEYIGANI